MAVVVRASLLAACNSTQVNASSQGHGSLGGCLLSLSCCSQQSTPVAAAAQLLLLGWDVAGAA